MICLLNGCLISVLLVIAGASKAAALEPIQDKLMVLTFGCTDGSHFTRGTDIDAELRWIGESDWLHTAC